MGCFGLDGNRRRLKNGFFERSSPALQQILLQHFRLEERQSNKWVGPPVITFTRGWTYKDEVAENPKEIDHRLYEFGSVEYHVQSIDSDPQDIHLSISTPVLTPRTLLPQGLCCYTKQKVKEISPNAIDILDTAKAGYQLTLRLKFAHILQVKDGVKIIKEIAAIASVILSSQLKEMLRNFSSIDGIEETHKPIKIMYHPKEPFFVARQPEKITVVFPMRFKDTSDVVIATSFFQDLMDIGNTEPFAKAPPCTWSPIPPPELRGEPIAELSTNGGFVSFDIFARHVEDKRLDNTVWNLLNFYTYVKSYIKGTKGFIQRKLRKRLGDLVKMLDQPSITDDEHEEQLRGCGCKMKSASISRFRKQYGDVKKRIKRVRYRIRIHGFGELNRKIKGIHHQIKCRGFSLHRQWFSSPNIDSPKGYTKLE